MATATATVAPTIGLFPIPISPTLNRLNRQNSILRFAQEYLKNEINQRYSSINYQTKPYFLHTEIMERFQGIDLDAAAKVAGNGFYYFMGDIARLHSAVIAYARIGTLGSIIFGITIIIFIIFS